MSDQPSLLFLTSFYPTDEHPHHGIFFRDHAEALAKYCDVSVLTVRTPTIRQTRQLRRSVRVEKINGVTVIEVIQPVLTHRLTSRKDQAEIDGLEAGYQLYLSEQHVQPELLIAQTALQPGKWARHLHKEYASLPYVIIEHFSFLSEMFGRQEEEMRAVYEDASAIVSVSDHLQTKVDAFLEQQAITKPTGVIGNVIGRTFEHQAFISASPAPPFRWLFVGPDDQPKKGIDILVEALPQLKTPDWQLTIVGEGTYSSLLNSEISARVTSHQPVDRAQMVALMQHHHALVSSSRVETFGMAIVEMLSCGRPVVATRCGGPQEYMTDNLGELVEPEDPAALAQAMDQVMEQYEHYDQKAIRSLIIERFGGQAFYQRLKHLFSQAKIYI
ncbi:MAG: glycosyltransferase [Bacteroidota bacterium]